MSNQAKMRVSRLWRLVVLLALTAFVLPVSLAQEGDGVLTNADVFVTTQHQANLRLGPGTGWEVITVLPAGTTLRATGRVFNWVQVRYTPPEATEPVQGWLWRDLLIWTGDLNSLPLDGVEPEPFARVQGYTLTLRPDMLIYRNNTFAIGARVIEPLPCTDVELTGRLGSGSVRWLQFWCAGAYYWVGSHYFWDTSGSSSSVFRSSTSDNNFGYRYGDLVIKLGNTGYTVRQRLGSLISLWDGLSHGQPMSCTYRDYEALGPVPLSAEDLERYPRFVAPVRALQMVIDRSNAALDLFRAACAGIASQPFIATTTVQTAQTYLREAQDYLYLAQQFYYPLANRDPYAGGDNEAPIP